MPTKKIPKDAIYLCLGELVEAHEVKTKKRTAQVRLGRSIHRVRKALTPHIGQKIRVWFQLINEGGGGKCGK